MPRSGAASLDRSLVSARPARRRFARMRRPTMNRAAPPPEGQIAPAHGVALFSSPLLAWYFVAVWGSGYLATKVGLQYAPPFTFLTLRFLLGLALLAPLLALWHRHQPLRWPQTRRDALHVAAAGLLMHAVNLGGSHYAQYLGLSAGVTALVLAAQPLATAVVAAALLGERLRRAQWLGVAVGLLGVLLVVWHKIDARAVGAPALAAVLTALAAITAGTLYQRRFRPNVDLRAATALQFALTAIVLAPLAVGIEGFALQPHWALAAAILYLVVFASILAVNALHTLMRRGESTRVTSLLYLTPLFAVALEWAMFAVVPTRLTALGVAVTCAGVALVAWQPRSRASRPQP
jgi:drug/metabolite transporter (DMT)-like permease